MKNIEEFIKNSAIYAWLWAFWWIAFYLNKVRNWVTFSLSLFFINIFISGWIWVITNEMLPWTFEDYRIWLISISWFLAYPILNYLEENWLNIFLNKYWIWPNNEKK